MDPLRTCTIFLVLFAMVEVASCAVRKYYIATQDLLWDYAPGGTNLVNPSNQGGANMFVKRSEDRIGSQYKKVTYFQYTDDTFQTEIAKPPYLGFLGPVIRGEVGDTILVTFLNNASGTYSAHPHGVFYEKFSEGAIYLDGTSGRYKSDEIVLPGERVVLTWKVTDSDAPGELDPPCLPWVYHSHVDTVKDTSAGLIGVVVTCRPGVLDDNNERTDVDREYPLLIKNWDENQSWYVEENMDAFCLDPAACRRLQQAEDEGFMDSNYMRGINGAMYGHLDGLQACVGDRVQFYVIGFGNEFDVHSLHFHGQVLKYQHTRGDTVSVYSATFVAAEMVPHEAGFWRIADMVDSNEQDGMAAFFFTKNCDAGKTNSSQVNGITREYFLAAEEVTWNYAPTGHDGRTGLPLDSPGSQSQPYFEHGPSRLGGVYHKAMFVQYTDKLFTTRARRSASEMHMGLLGPVLRAEVGDTLKVTLTNTLRFPVSLLPHAVEYSFTEEITGGSGGASIAQGQMHTYEFHVPDTLLDDAKEPCLNFLYTSAHDQSHDHNTGLVGPLLICRKGALNSNNDTREFFLLLTIFDENKSLLLQDNINTYSTIGPAIIDQEDDDFVASNQMFSINGYAFGNLPSLSMCLYEDVTWYVMSLGSDLDVHTVTFDGNTFTEAGKHRDGRHLVPGSTAALHMEPDNLGTWAVQSHSTIAIDGGMYGFYTVGSCSGSNKNNSSKSTGITRRFYIAAEEVEWDYAPLERSVITGADLNDPRSDGNIFIRNDEYFIGDVYKKAVFRGYTDATFTSETSATHDDLLGPAMMAEVGDIIEITFKNMATRPYSLHSQGLKTTQADSGVNYGSATGVDPGQTYQYTWEVPERSGPGSRDPNCIPWLYYSSVDPVKDTNSGLVGALVVCRPGTLDVTSRRTDVDREFFILMSVNNENLSWYLDHNVATYAPALVGTDYRNDPDFEESNKLHAINGRVFGNNPGLYMEYNSSVAWYMMALGAEIDLHSIHLHGHTFLHTSEKHRDDVIQIFPGMAESVEMLADNPGTWLLHCHVLDHIFAGMETTYTVLQPGEKAQPGSIFSPNTIVG